MKAHAARQLSNQRKAILEIAAVFSDARLDDDQRNAKASNVLIRYCKNVTIRREEAILDTGIEVSEMIKKVGKRTYTADSSNLRAFEALTAAEGDTGSLGSGAVETIPATAISSHQAAVNSLQEMAISTPDFCAAFPGVQPVTPFEQVPTLFRTAIWEAKASGNPHPEETAIIEYALALLEQSGNVNIRTREQEEFYAGLLMSLDAEEQIRIAYSPSNVTVH
jgi:hypothetical protein